MLLGEGKFEIKLPVFHGSSGEYYRHWKIRVKAALRGKDLIDAMDNNRTDNIVSMKALSINISGLEDNPLRIIQDCVMAIARGQIYIIDTPENRWPIN